MYLRLSREYAINPDGPTDWELNGKTYRLVQMLKHDTWAAVALVEREGTRYAFKVSRARGRFERLLQPLMNFISRHEYDVYAVCDGLAGIPPLAGRVGRNAYLHEYVDGVTLDVNQNVTEGFFDELEAIVDEIHNRGVAYVDMAKRENIIVGEDGHPYLIDFQISLKQSHGRGPLAWLKNRLVKMFQREDIYHLAKNRDRILCAIVPGYQSQYTKRRTLFTTFHRIVLRKPYHLIKRRFVPKHGDTTYHRDGEEADGI